MSEGKQIKNGVNEWNRHAVRVMRKGYAKVYTASRIMHHNIDENEKEDNENGNGGGGGEDDGRWYRKRCTER